VHVPARPAETQPRDAPASAAPAAAAARGTSVVPAVAPAGPTVAPISSAPDQTPPASPAVDAAPASDESIAALFARQLEVLQAASARLSRAEGSEAVGRAVVEETGRIIDYHNARVYVLEPAGDLVPIAFEGRVGAYEKVDLNLLRTRLGHGFTGWVGQHGEPLLVRDANDDPRGASIPGTDDVDESMLVVPMRYDDAVVGVITLSKLGLDQFDGHDLRLLSILADQAATALESARNLARSHSLAGELRLLLEVSSELAGSLESRQVRTSSPATWPVSWASRSARSRSGTGPTTGSRASATSRRSCSTTSTRSSTSPRIHRPSTCSRTRRPS